MHQSGFMAAAALYAVTHNIERLSDDHKNARILYEIIKKENPEIEINEPMTNILMVNIKNLGCKSEKFVEICKKSNVLLYPYNEYIVRAIISLNVNKEDVEFCGKVINRELNEIRRNKKN